MVQAVDAMLELKNFPERLKRKGGRDGVRNGRRVGTISR